MVDIVGKGQFSRKWRKKSTVQLHGKLLFHSSLPFSVQNNKSREDRINTNPKYC